MDIVWVAYLFAVAAGLVSAGIIGSLLGGFYGKPCDLSMVIDPATAAPVRVLLAVSSMPILLFRFGQQCLARGYRAGAVLLPLSLGWSFCQGVFILTTIFGVV